MQSVYKNIPYTLLWDKAPIDISFVFSDEKPAGKHGFLTAQGDKFVFEDGTEQRFWGTNFNSGANFPEHSHSEKVACRLASMGINMVRLHQIDAEWSTPNIFRFTKGPLCDNTRSLDPQSMERLDYLIYCLKQQGIYIYVDMLCYRKFKTGDGAENVLNLPEAGKPHSNYARRLIELQKELNRLLWEHYNPYTKLCYKDEPAIALAEITNENDLFCKHFKNNYKLEPYYTEFLELYAQWAVQNGREIDLDSLRLIDFAEADEQIAQFKSDVMKAYYSEIISHCRALGVKVPITGTNWSTGAGVLEAQMTTDFTDSHAYTQIHDQRAIRHDSMISKRYNMLTSLAFNRVPDKPFFVSEWDEPWPNKHRAAATLLMAAAGSLQGWMGFTIHTYRYGTNEQESVTEKIGRDIVIGSSFYRGTFDTYNDPAKFGLFYHAALITRRADVKRANETAAIKYPNLLARTGCKASALTPEKHLAVTHLPGRQYEDADYAHAPEDTTLWGEDGEVTSDTGELYRSLDAGFGTIDTPMTKAVYGFHARNNLYNLSGVAISVKNDFATVAISSLSQNPICASANMLLTMIGYADNKDVLYHENETRQVHSGTGPVVIEVIRAKISITTDIATLKVWSVDNEGFYTGAIPATYENGIFSFETGGEFASMYYLIQAQ